MKFILVQQFYAYTGFKDIEYKPFWINLDHIKLIRHYDVDIHTAVNYDPVTKEHHKQIPQGALDTIFVNFSSDEYGYHLDQESSKKVLEAIKL